MMRMISAILRFRILANTLVEIDKKVENSFKNLFITTRDKPISGRFTFGLSKDDRYEEPERSNNQRPKIQWKPLPEIEKGKALPKAKDQTNPAGINLFTRVEKSKKI